MSARVTALADLSERDLGRWRDLAARAVEPNVFFEPDFVLAAQRGLNEQGVGVLIVEGGDRWIGCVPVRRAHRWRRLPIPVLGSWRHRYSFLGTPLVDRDSVAAALSELVAHGRADASGLFALERVGADGPVWATLTGEIGSALTRHTRFEHMERAALVRRPEATYLDEMKPHRRRELNRQGRGLEKEMGGQLVLRDRAGDPAAYDDFLRLEAEGWKGREGTALSANEGHAAFFRSVCATYAGLGRLEILDLSVDGQSVAMKCNFRSGGVAFCFKIAYDEKYATYSPGLQLERRTVETFHERREVCAMDSCADPDNEMINRLWPDRRSLETIVFSADGTLGALSYLVARAAVSAHARRRRPA